jgi:hypothetical protein
MTETETLTYARAFLAAIAERVAQVGANEITKAESNAATHADCERGAAMFRTDALALWMHEQLPMYTEPTADAPLGWIVREAFALCVLAAYDAINFHAAHNYGAEALQDDLDGIAAEFALFLCCRPGPFAQSAGVIARKLHG